MSAFRCPRKKRGYFLSSCLSLYALIPVPALFSCPAEFHPSSLHLSFFSGPITLPVYLAFFSVLTVIPFACYQQVFFPLPPFLVSALHYKLFFDDVLSPAVLSAILRCPHECSFALFFPRRRPPRFIPSMPKTSKWGLPFLLSLQVSRFF